jgi:hypothetical protein
MSRRFELHVGFPKKAENAVKAFINSLARENREKWSCSEVDAVYSEAAAEDQHNVPGTLGFLVSKSFSDRDVTSDEEVLAEAQWVISKLAEIDVPDARLEIEYVFGYLTRRKNDDDSGASLRFSEPPEWSDQMLKLEDGRRLRPPNSEIHFIFEMEEKGESAISNEEAAEILAAYGVEVQQTIEYRSQTMIKSGREDKKVICTSYYDSPVQAEKAARRLFVNTRLCEELAERGYSLRLMLERILGCFQPLSKLDHHSSQKSGIDCAVV